MSPDFPEPGPGRDVVGNLFAALGAAYAEMRAEEKRRREARRNSPEAKARRSAAAQQGWETRRATAAAREAERAAERAYWADREAAYPDGPLCDGIFHDSRGSEMRCMLPPDHDEEFCGDPDN